MLTTAEVAERLQVTQRRVQALIKDKRLPAERYGRAWLVQRTDLEAFIAKWDRRPGRPTAT